MRLFATDGNHDGRLGSGGKVEFFGAEGDDRVGIGVGDYRKYDIHFGKGGQRYVGPFLLIEKRVGHVETQPFYDAWDSVSYGAWDVGGVNPWFEPGWGISVWVDHYDGRIVSTLQGDRGGSARCHFTLSHTSVGLPGGGSGECQVSDGGVLDATF